MSLLSIGGTGFVPVVVGVYKAESIHIQTKAIVAPVSLSSFFACLLVSTPPDQSSGRPQFYRVLFVLAIKRAIARLYMLQADYKQTYHAGLILLFRRAVAR